MMALPTMPDAPTTRILLVLFIVLIHLKSCPMEQFVPFGLLQICLDHLANEGFKSNLRFPSQFFFCLGRITEQLIDFGRVYISRR